MRILFLFSLFTSLRWDQESKKVGEQKDKKFNLPQNQQFFTANRL